MGLRKASSYTKFSARPYTRKSKKKGKNFIKTVPANKIVKMSMGDITGYNANKYSQVIKIVSAEKITIQMRDNAIEAARQGILKALETNTPGQYYFEIKTHPHHVLRENKMQTGAGADRMQTGMAQSFGRTIGRAAFVHPGRIIFLIAFNLDKVKETARIAIDKIRPKLPCKTKVLIEKI